MEILRKISVMFAPVRKDELEIEKNTRTPANPMNTLALMRNSFSFLPAGFPT